MIAIEKIVFYYSHHVGPYGESPGSVMRQRGKEELWARAFIIISTGRNGGSMMNSLGSAGYHSFSGLCSPTSRLVPSSGVIKAGGYWPGIGEPDKGGD